MAFVGGGIRNGVIAQQSRPPIAIVYVATAVVSIEWRRVVVMEQSRTSVPFRAFSPTSHLPLQPLRPQRCSASGQRNFQNFLRRKLLFVINLQQLQTCFYWFAMVYDLCHTRIMHNALNATRASQISQYINILQHQYFSACALLYCTTFCYHNTTQSQDGINIVALHKRILLYY